MELSANVEKPLLPSSAHGSPLFLLPRELRDQIYDILFCDSSYVVLQDVAVTVLRYGESDEQRHELPSWLLTNKQILNEGLEQFFRKARCTSCGSYTFLNGFRLLPHPAKFRGTRYLSDTIIDPSPPRGRGILTARNRVRIIEIDQKIRLNVYSDFIPGPSFASHTLKRRRCETRDTIYISSVVTSLPLNQFIEEQRESLKVLKLTLIPQKAFEFDADTYDGKDWDIDLDIMKFNASLERAEFAIQKFKWTQPRSAQRSYAVAMTALHHELLRIATSLVHSANKECKITEWHSDVQQGCHGGRPVKWQDLHIVATQGAERIE